MEVEEFLNFLKSDSPSNIAEQLILRSGIYMFRDEDEYTGYKKQILVDHGNAHHISIVGSANWKFSLNPTKNLSIFSKKSDIDVAIICAQSYLDTWNEMRKFHRENFYALAHDARVSLRRHGEDVYSGFASPKWIPSIESKVRQRYEKLTNKYSDRQVGFRKVNMMYFRDMGEAVDYYVRGIRKANEQRKKWTTK
ncbi:hypothetical protein [Pseudomonas veronii]|jgi:hypothetical protein|uniref:hypothetical protein n=1 Tax=Pseudomonas veronii TaxID=76761 RepID=UPI0023DFE0BE|nr:hypothetical protein [Pseudomonas veronii]MDF3239618.1 hypothetical protein [Pseudomonas veronii]